MPSTIELTGQVITYVNYFRNPATGRQFYFSPGNVASAAHAFLDAGIDKIEIPDGVLNPDLREDCVVDKDTFDDTLSLLPKETRVIATYIGSQGIEKKALFVENTNLKLSFLLDAFPDLKYVQMHPHGRQQEVSIKDVVAAWAEVADYMAEQRPGSQVCFHNHYDTRAESVDEVRMFLQEIEKAKHPALKWGLDTGHLSSVGDKEYLNVLNEYAHLVGDYFHIKARNPQMDAQDKRYVASNDPTSKKTYRGFVNPADQGVDTPFDPIFTKLRSAEPDRKIYGALEIDCPRQHPMSEIRDAVIHLTLVRGLATGKSLPLEELARL